MKNKKTVYKYFTIPAWRKEEEYLSQMHEKGWKFTGANLPGLYHFEKCEPQPVTYRLDYNKEGRRYRGEYVQMFRDCGWEYVCDFVGFSYFRKEGSVGEAREEIFCDETSRLEMMKRVFRGRIIPLILVFLFSVLPQMFMQLANYGKYGDAAAEVLSYVFLGLAVVYLVLFAHTAVQFYKYEKNVSGESAGLRRKYAGLIALIVLILAGTGVSFWAINRSVYEVRETTDGYVVTADRLKSTVTKEYDLKKGDFVDYHIDYKHGRFHLSIAEENKKDNPWFFGDFYKTGDGSVGITEAGHYLVEVSGDHAEGQVEYTIRYFSPN